MNTLRSIQNIWRDYRGFTLIEVLATITIMGILAGIAIPSWFSVVESRRVDSATNQLVGDLRLANNKASNRLTTYRVCVTSNSTTYRIGAGTCGSLEIRVLPDGTETAATFPGYTGNVPIAFCANGSAESPPSSPVCPNGSATPFLLDTTTIKVTSDGNPCMDVKVNTLTSRVSSARASSCP